MRRLICLILLTCAACRGQDQALRFDLKNGYLIVVQCSVGELHGLNGVIDTGTTDTVFDSRLVTRLSLSTSRSSALMVDREVVVSNVVAPVIRMGARQALPKAPIAADLSRMAEQFGVRIDVIIGMDVLRASDFEIDYRARLLRFGTVTSMVHRAAITNEAGLATVELTGLGAPVHLLVDTGFSDVLLFGTRLGADLKARDAEVKLATNASPAKLQAFEPAMIRIGDWQGHQRTLLVTDAPRAQGVPFDGLLGPRFLNARRIVFDFSHGILSWD